MSAPSKFSTEDVIAAAFAVVRKDGWDSLSARAIADALKSSTMPIYSRLKSMGNLEEELVRRAVQVLEQSMTMDRTGNRALDGGLGYVAFALDEKHLFAGINDEKRTALQRKFGHNIQDALIQRYRAEPFSDRLSESELEELMLHWWVSIHGLASLAASGYLADKNRDQISEIVQQTGSVILSGFLRELSRRKDNRALATKITRKPAGQTT
jgi:AcrR family transcriptional regulator